jgi:hypothetical protein
MIHPVFYAMAVLALVAASLAAITDQSGRFVGVHEIAISSDQEPQAERARPLRASFAPGTGAQGGHCPGCCDTARPT